jgi:hypothetical protein
VQPVQEKLCPSLVVYVMAVHVPALSIVVHSVYVRPPVPQGVAAEQLLPLPGPPMHAIAAWFTAVAQPSHELHEKDCPATVYVDCAHPPDRDWVQVWRV